MRKILTIFLFTTVLVPAISSSLKENILISFKLLRSNPDSAYVFTKNLQIEAKQESNDYALVQTNYVLGYLMDKKGEYGKAILFYLEAIRYAQNASYESAMKDLIAINKNCGVVFRKFKAYKLAEEYYAKALDLAKFTDNIEQQVGISYNLAFVYRDQNKTQEAIDLLNSALSLSNPGSKQYFKILNSLGSRFQETDDFKQSIAVYEKLLKELPTDNYKMRAFAFHNLGRSLEATGKVSESISSYQNAIEKGTVAKSDLVLFNANIDLGELYSGNEMFKEAEQFLSKAETLITNLQQKPEYFKLHKSQSDLYYAIGDYEASKKYQDLYNKKLNNYLATQEEIINTDQRYNMDLITQRYFDMVEKEAQIDAILFYSKLISGTLLFLLLATIGINSYKKIRLRKAIEKDLVALKIVEP